MGTRKSDNETNIRKFNNKVGIEKQDANKIEDPGQDDEISIKE